LPASDFSASSFCKLSSIWFLLKQMPRLLTDENREFASGVVKADSTTAPVSSASPSGIQIALLFAINIFLSAFLLFQVELMMGKFVLPRYGGGPSVWTTALLVFQVLLLGGYAYAARISARLSPKRQAKVHLWLIGICAVLLILQVLLWHVPLFPRVSWLSGGSDYPISQISALLLLGAGVPCVLLSAHSPLCQNWLSSSQASPYRLYAVSNLGSLLGLISYPFLVERTLTLTSQAWVWSGLFALVLVLSAVCAFLRMRDALGSNSPGPRPTRKTANKAKVLVHEPRLLWLALASCSSAMLLAMTNMICQQVAPIPLLWVLPLSLYLLSFVICFDHSRWYHRGIFALPYVVCGYLTLAALPRYTEAPTVQLVTVLCVTLFVVCMICHGELARSKPPAEQLPSFYLTIAAGGALGSAFVALLAPRIFDRFWECYVALLGCGVLLVITVLRDPRSWARRTRYGVAIVMSLAVVLGLGAIYMTNFLLEREKQGVIIVERTRNFFGVKTIAQEPETLDLIHGRTLHGMQSTVPAYRNLPLMYYSRFSGVGLLLNQFPRTPDHPNLRVGVIGMGTGTLAAYGKAGDYYRFYEIDPAVIGFSSGNKPYFTFVQSSLAKVDVVEGDARMRLQQELSRGEQGDFDVLVIDAFSGDSIPVHLLTREAMDLYLQRIREPKSVLAFHVSNSSLDLRPVLDSLARSHQLAAVEIHTPVEVHPTWILLSRDPAALRAPNLVAEGKELKTSLKIAGWTDNYSSLYQLFFK
jgi:hypothetical protein